MIEIVVADLPGESDGSACFALEEVPRLDTRGASVADIVRIATWDCVKDTRPDVRADMINLLQQFFELTGPIPNNHDILLPPYKIEPLSDDLNKPIRVSRRTFKYPTESMATINSLVNDGVLSLLEHDDRTSQYLLPPVPILKNDGSIRLTMNMIPVNKISVKYPQNLPSVADFAQTFAGCMVFSSIDFKQFSFNFSWKKMVNVSSALLVLTAVNSL